MVDMDSSLAVATTVLKKRDGIDKLLKLLRYGSRAGWWAFRQDGANVIGDTADRFWKFERACNGARKALRLGKFLHNIEAARAELSCSSRPPLLMALSVGAEVGDCIYYFLEQILWLQKSGALRLRRVDARRVEVVAALAELLGYACAGPLQVYVLWALAEEEWDVIAKGKKDGEDYKAGYTRVQEKLAEIRERQSRSFLKLVQIAADGSLAINTLQDGNSIFGHPIPFSLLGILSAAISLHKLWPR